MERMIVGDNFFLLQDVIFTQKYIQYRPLLTYNLVAPITSFFSTHFAFRDHCKKHHPELNPFSCAGVYFNVKKMSDIEDYLGDND